MKHKPILVLVDENYTPAGEAPFDDAFDDVEEALRSHGLWGEVLELDYSPKKARDLLEEAHAFISEALVDGEAKRKDAKSLATRIFNFLNEEE